MSKEQTTNKAIDNSQHYMSKYTFGYTGVDGRRYIAEKEIKPEDTEPHLTKKKIAIGLHQEKMNAAAISHIEDMLSLFDRMQDEGKELSCGKIKGNISVKRRSEIIEKYSLQLNSDSGLYEGNPEMVFEMLRSEHPSCLQFKNLKELHYAVRFGYTPVRKINKAD